MYSHILGATEIQPTTLLWRSHHNSVGILQVQASSAEESGDCICQQAGLQKPSSLSATMTLIFIIRGWMPELFIHVQVQVQASSTAESGGWTPQLATLRTLRRCTHSCQSADATAWPTPPAAPVLLMTFQRCVLNILNIILRKRQASTPHISAIWWQNMIRSSCLQALSH